MTVNIGGIVIDGDEIFSNVGIITAIRFSTTSFGRYSPYNWWSDNWFGTVHGEQIINVVALRPTLFIMIKWKNI